MRGRGAIAAAFATAFLVVPATAAAAPPPEGAAISDNLEYVHRSSEAAGITEGKFDTVRGKDVLVITGRFGFKTYDVEDPANPVLLDEFLPADLAERGYWQNEDMELDTKRKLIIGALDPRHTDLGATTASPCPPGGSVNLPACKSGFYVISYANPSNMEQIGDFVDLPSGHTSSCIQNCKYIWTGGPARTRNPALRWLGPILSPTAPDPWTFDRLVGDGRPIWVTDLSDPRNPEVSDQPVDLWRNDGYTDYSHDVDEDEQGIAWVSGRGGIRGYATSGRHRDPYQNRWRTATPLDPILVAGGGVAGTAQEVMLMHNSGRPTDGSVRASGVKKGNVLVGTEEEFTRPCDASGKIVLSDLTDSWGGEPAQQSTLDDPYRMQALDTFHPHIDTPEGDTDPGDDDPTTPRPQIGCSAHYFEIEGSLLGAGWYGQGLRLLDISNARDVEQVGYYRVTGTSTSNPNSNSWDMAFRTVKGDRGSRKDYAYLFDMSRGIEVLKIKQGGIRAARRMKAVTAPKLKSARFAAKPVGSLGRAASFSDAGGTGYICPLFQ
jgi:hypothetical protein